MLVMGVFGKFSALLVSLPEPVIGGIFTVMSGNYAPPFSSYAGRAGHFVLMMSFRSSSFFTAY